jgi:acyl dehydratase
MFAAFSGDWNAVHTDAESAKASVFGERIAHGMLTLVVGTGLLFRLSESPLIPKSLIAVAGIDKVRFVAPVRIGDTIYLEGEVAEMNKMPDGKGILSLKYHIKNQHEESVVTGRLKLIAGCQPPGRENV